MVQWWANGDDTMDYMIDWEDYYYEDLQPRTEETIIYRVTYSTIYETSVASEGFNMKPGMIYLWDPAKGDEVISTGECTWKKVRRSTTSGGSGGNKWVKHNRGYIWLDGSKAKYCQASSGKEYIGSYSGGKINIVFDVRQGAEFTVEFVGDTMNLIQEFSSGHSTSTVYYSSETYPFL